MLVGITTGYVFRGSGSSVVNVPIGLLRGRPPMGERPIFPPVPMPVDITDKEQFPELARALEHARKLRKDREANR